MAWTKKQSGPFVTLIPDGTTDFNFAAEVPGHAVIAVEEVQYFFSAANDVLSMRTHTTDGAEVFPYKTLDGTSKAKLFHGAEIVPIFINSEQTMSDPTKVRIVIQLSKPVPALGF
jgi:hypothetical protein